MEGSRKKRSTLGSRTSWDVQQARKVYREHARTLNVRDLVFPDESGMDTRMVSR